MHAEFDPEKRRLIEKAGLSGLMAIGGLVVPSAAMRRSPPRRRKRTKPRRKNRSRRRRI